MKPPQTHYLNNIDRQHKPKCLKFEGGLIRRVKLLILQRNFKDGNNQVRKG
jgi:hypothetical protein